MAVEILAGNGIHKAFKALGINAKRTYKSAHEPYYEVWELDKKDLKTLDEAYEWPDEWGFYRFAKGSNMGTACSFFTVNGQELIAWDGAKRDDLYDDWDSTTFEERAEYNHSFKKYEEEMMPKVYDNLLHYMCEEIGAVMATNVCALAVDLARANGKTMAKLFEIYEG